MRWRCTAPSMPHSAPSPTLPRKRGRAIRAAADVLRASFLYLSHRRGLQRFVTRQRLTAALAYRFVAGDRLDDAVRVVTDLNGHGFTASPDPLGANVSEVRSDRARFEAEMQQLLLEGSYPTIATHDDRLIEATRRFARARNIAPDRFEFQMLYGIRRDLQDRLLREGYRVRIYVPYGTEWYPYLMRRL